jgi:hypothetical protein
MNGDVFSWTEKSLVVLVFGVEHDLALGEALEVMEPRGVRR